jgi:uncharacterized membrane protein
MLLGPARRDFVGLLYLGQLGLWTRLFGRYEFILRLPSTLFGILSLPLGYQIARRLLQEREAQYVLWLLVLSPLGVWYAREVRFYSLACFLGLVCVYGWLSWQETGHRGYLFLYALAGLAGLYTSYAFLFLLALVNLGFWYTQASSLASEGRWIVWLGAQAIILIGFAPWWPIFVGHVRWVAQDLNRWRALYALFSLLGRVGLSPRQGWILVAGALGLGLVALVWVGLRGRRWIQRLDARLTRAPWPWLWGVLPYVALMAVAGLRPISSVRQATLVAPYLAVIAVFSLRYIRWPRRWVWTALLVVLLLLTLRNHLVTQKEQWRQVGKMLTRQTSSRDVIVLHAYYAKAAFDYYYRGPALVVPLREPIPARLTQLQSYPRVWLVLSHDIYVDPEGNVQAWFRRHGRLQQSYDWVGVQADLYVLEAP